MSLLNEKIDISFENILNNDYQGFILGFSVVGDHNQNQDSYRYKLGNNILLSIADGLGSAPSSKIGSDLATKIVIEDSPCNGEKDEFHIIYKTWKNILGKENLLDYDTTLKYICIKNQEVRFYNVGDGVTYIETDDDKYLFTINDDFINETDSLCSYSTNQSNYFKKLFFDNKVCIVMYTDGIDYFFDTSKISGFTKEIINMFHSRKDIKKSILEWIESWEDKNYYDDKTMIVLFLERR
jgi:serine/threonine protein phosphatase PrpC